MNSRRSVALLIESSNAYARGLLAGVVTYVRQHANWSIFLPEQERGATPPKWLSSWNGDGLLVRIETDEIARVVRKSKLPLVDLSAARYLSDVPWVETDDSAIAILAAEHLMERGFQHLAYCGDPGFQWSILRHQEFEKQILQPGRSFHLHESIPRYDEKYSWKREKRRLANWIEKLPKPVAIFACYDIKAQQLLDVCRELGISVPEQVAVLGVDNDELLCELCSPPLSSVIPNAHQAGFQAAAMLDRMMNGEEVSTEAIFIEPLGIQTRQSTDLLAIDDADIAKAFRYIREHATANIRVSDLLRHIPLSRRMLEHRFLKYLGRTPHQEIQRQRILKVKDFLCSTNLTLAEIARNTGFEHAEYLSVVFKRETGQTPREYRNQTGTNHIWS
ncbi:AraC family transcriptional regulator [Rubinisphaera italica]|uniref:Xylose operon regulatory protein n=1 Tax=Rubinisphaera italica TaxID=2527969 RepID=A0A5C5XF30_9PLAN|nr:DNA-binding transcriptional regulator [Rubinisphaera italica]TWT61590.1 Xylose operon regulatory protein [Rubinisphaera italica]